MRYRLSELVANGASADIYLERNRIIKLYKPHMPRDAAEQEAQKQQLAAALGICVPEVIDVCEIESRQALVMQHIKGRTLAQLIREGADHAPLAGMAAALQAQMHEKNCLALATLGKMLTRQINSAVKIGEYRKANLIAQLGALPQANRLCHGDFHYENIILSDGKLYLIDWVDAAAGSPCADAARTYLLLSAENEVYAEEYLACYCNCTGRTREEILDWLPVVAGARLGEKLPESELERVYTFAK